jgi:hypothetical protein
MASRVEGLDRAIESLRQKAERMRDLGPALKVFGRFVETNVDDCFDQSRDWDGTPFPPLAESTIERRIGNLKAANKRTKSGELTKAAKTLRDKLRSPGGIKPLVDTARARNSQHTDAGPESLIWTSVGYLGYHFTGNERLPQRNVSPFVFLNSNNWRLHPRAKVKLHEVVTQHVQRGEAAE